MQHISFAYQFLKNQQAQEHLQISNVLTLGHESPTIEQPHINLFKTKRLLKTKPVVTIIERSFSTGGADREPL